MKPFGVILIILGLIAGVIAFQMETSVATGYLGLDRVNNIGLMDQRRNYLIVSGLSVLSGVLLFGFGSIRGSENGEPGGESDLRPCPFCAEQIRKAAMVCRFCNRDVPPIASSSNLGQSSEVIVSASTPKTSCWTCTHFNESDRWIDAFTDKTKGTCTFHKRPTFAYDTCDDYTTKNT